MINWACYKHSIKDADVSTLGDWLYSLATIASDVVTYKADNASTNNKKAQNNAEISKNSKSKNHVNSQNEVKNENSKNFVPRNNKKCPACNKDHCNALAFCEKFKRLERQARWNLVKSNNLCACCFGHHRYSQCKQKKVCGVTGCSFYHHVLLHNNSKAPETIKPKLTNDDEQPKNANSMKIESSATKFPDIFRIVPVRIYFNGQSMQIFAYLDDGSNLTTIELTVAKKIGIHGTNESLCIKWSFGETQVESNSERVSFQISGVFEGAEKFYLHDVRTVSKLNLPSQSITKKWLGQYSYLKDIPVTPYENVIPQMIIGLQYSKLTVSLHTIEGDWSQPIVCRTRLGWVVQGPNDKQISTNSSRKISLNMCECQSLDNNLHQMVNEFFSIENFEVKISDKIIGSKDVIRAQNILESTILKGNDYEAALLWRKDDVHLSPSYEMAKRRLKCVESRMKKDPVLAERMCDYIKDFLDKGYIRKLTQIQQENHGPRTWYLPIFPVFNPKKPKKLDLV